VADSGSSNINNEKSVIRRMLIVPNEQVNDRVFRRLTKGDNIALGTGIAIAHSIRVDVDDNIIVNWILFTLIIITPIRPILS
jgi:mannitol/fructose-specific phosphotransferase system IIA component (Ntr-type)